MKVNNLKKIGGILPADLTPVDISWTDDEGNTYDFTVYVRAIRYAEMETALTAHGEGHSYVSALIAECLRLGDAGEEKLTYEDAAGLNPGLAKLFSNAIASVTKDAKKKS